MCIAASMIAVATVEPAFAQAAQQQSSVWGDPAPQQPAKGADSPWGPPPSAAAPAAASPWDQPQQPPPCVAEFVKLRDAAEQRAIAIRKASARKASPKEACGLFGALSTAQLKMIKYAKEHQKDCGIPVQIIDQISQSQHQVSDIRTKVCEAANRPARSAVPTLSDALTTPVPNSNNIKTGRGTFDTLTGSPLGER
jgi:hypothetical protein